MNIKVYLASPFSHIDPDVRISRAISANKKAAELMELGYLVFSPISHSFPISEYCNVDPCDNDFWLRQDLWVLEICDEFHVLCLDGWKESIGIMIEMDRAKLLELKVVYHEI